MEELKEPFPVLAGGKNKNQRLDRVFGVNLKSRKIGAEHMALG